MHDKAQLLYFMLHCIKRTVLFVCLHLMICPVSQYCAVRYLTVPRPMPAVVAILRLEVTESLSERSSCLKDFKEAAVSSSVSTASPVHHGSCKALPSQVSNLTTQAAMRGSLAQWFSFPKWRSMVSPRKQLPGTLLGPPGPTRQETLEAIEQHTKKHKGLRQGWQVKAATWVKKVHVSRGHVEVGMLTKDGRFKINPWALPRYMVPPGLAESKLRPYVAPYDEAKVVAEMREQQEKQQAGTASPVAGS